MQSIWIIRICYYFLMRPILHTFFLKVHKNLVLKEFSSSTTQKLMLSLRLIRIDCNFPYRKSLNTSRLRLSMREIEYHVTMV